MGLNIKDLDGLTGVATNDKVPVIDTSDTSDSAEGSLKLTTVSEFTASLGGGDMTKATYDQDDDGVVDNSEALGGQNSAYHLSRTNHTGAQAISTITGLQTALDGKSATGHSHTESDISDLGAYLTDITGESLNDLSDVNTASATNGSVLKYNGSGWYAGVDVSGSGGSGGVTDHGALTGLSDDDHTQYHNDTRANTWLGTKTLDNITAGTTNKHLTATLEGKLNGIEALADVTDATNVAAAGAVMDSELIATSAGAGDAGKPIKLDAAGHVDATMINDADISLDNVSEGTTNKYYTATEKTKLSGIETAADVTDATNVAAAGAVMEGDTTTASMSFVVDEDNMASNLATKVPTQQSVKAYADTKAPIASPTFTGTVTLPTGLTGVLRADSGVVGTDTDVTDIVGAASTTAAGKVELAIGTEVTTGSSASLAVTPDALAESTIFGQKVLQATVFDYTTDVATGDGKFYFVIPQAMNGMNLVRVHARVITAGTTGTTDIQLHNVTDTQDMLSTKLTIDSGETGSDTADAAAVINATYDDLATNDLIRVDVDAVSTTAPKGLILTLEARLP